MKTKKHELLKYAYDNYPKGTKFLNLGASERTVCESNGVFYVDNYGVKDSETHYFIFGSGKWAEIVTEEPKMVAVKVENEKEFNTLMKYLKKDNKHFWEGITKNYKNENFYFYIDNDRGFDCDPLEVKSNGYTITHFSDFAKEHNLKVALLISEDGVELFEGDKYFWAYYSEIGFIKGWKTIKCFNLNKMHLCCSDSEQYRAFSTKQAALDWIEAQKPKEIEVQISSIEKVKVTKDRVDFGDNKFGWMSKENIEDILKAMEELNHEQTTKS